MSTASQYDVTVVVDQEPLGPFDTSSGMETTAEVNKRRQGGMRGEKAYPAHATHGDATVGRVYERERDHELARKLRGKVGWAKVTISRQPLGDDGVAWGTPIVSTGTLSGVTIPETDAESDDVGMLELTVVVTEVI
ncbi:hypothetical protein ACOACO_17440 [Nocardioides sp. CPCC 205120]|uniref:hypothetical protein n=1 Tax=Nocardioides sp. CPCC 205120 TaxID=3406462 RepID=UPI003B512EFE